MYDISQQAVSETATIDLETATGDMMMVPNPNGGDEKIQASVTIFGPGSKVHARATAKRNRAVVEAVRRGAKKLKDDEQREIDATFLAEVTASFNGFTYKDMSGFEMFKAAYMDISIGFIAEQVNRGLNDWANFSKRPATT